MEDQENEQEEYIRVGIHFYKKIYKPMLSGDKNLIYKKWSIHTLRLDNINLSEIKKFHDFIVYPSHTNFKQELNGFYNKYSKLNLMPLKGECPNILNFLRHIFGDQYELGLDYLKIIYENPTQLLPILCLVSDERNTGKTTFLNFLKEIFSVNMTINTNEDFRSQFNSSWLNKVIIGVDEALLDKVEDSERIKNLSTSRTIKEESKGVDKEEVEFFGKFILCSNNIKNFIKIDQQEIRYWVREIPVLANPEVNLLGIMRKEIPQFLNYLISRKHSVPQASRMWFTPQQIWTQALQQVKKNNRSPIEQQMLFILRLIIDSANVNIVEFTLKDIVGWLHQFGNNIKEIYKIKSIVHDSWGLQPYPNSSNYLQYSFDKNKEPISFKAKGRYYQIDSTLIPDN